MEEKQIQEFVHRFSQDETLREELISNPEGVIIREGFSPRVARVLMRLVPHLDLINGYMIDPLDGGAGSFWN